MEVYLGQKLNQLLNNWILLVKLYVLNVWIEYQLKSIFAFNINICEFFMFIINTSIILEIFLFIFGSNLKSLIFFVWTFLHFYIIFLTLTLKNHTGFDFLSFGYFWEVNFFCKEMNGLSFFSGKISLLQKRKKSYASRFVAKTYYRSLKQSWTVFSLVSTTQLSPWTNSW